MVCCFLSYVILICASCRSCATINCKFNQIWKLLGFHTNPLRRWVGHLAYDSKGLLCSSIQNFHHRFAPAVPETVNDQIWIICDLPYPLHQSRRNFAWEIEPAVCSFTTNFTWIGTLCRPAHVAQWLKHSAPCAVERDALSGRGSNLSPNASAY